MSHTIVATVLVLVGAFQAHAACDCFSISACSGCVPVDEQNECFDQCQWCIPKLACQQCPEVVPPTIPPTYNCSFVNEQCRIPSQPHATTVIGPHQAFKCQDEQGDGPTVMSVNMTWGDVNGAELWNGTLPYGESFSPTDVPTLGDPFGSISVLGQHWGEYNAPAGYTHQQIRLCPFIHMEASLHQHIGPPAASCYNCTKYLTNPPDLSSKLCGWTDPKTKTVQCSAITCSEIPAGIGQVSVFVSVFGEPASVVATQDAIPARGAFTEPLASFTYAGPKITQFSVPSRTCDLAGGDNKCMAQAGDNVTIVADNLPANMGIVEAYESWKPGQGLVVLIGNVPCENLELSKTGKSLQCTLPTSSGSSLPIMLTVGGQSQTIKNLFYYPAPAVTGVSPAHIPSYGGEITIHGTDFAATGQVKLVVSPELTLTCSDQVNYTVSSVTCNAPMSRGFSHLTSTKAVITFTTASGTSNTTTSIKYDQCAFYPPQSQPGGLCKTDGTQLCGNSYRCISPTSAPTDDYNQVCDFPDASCKCQADETLCQNGGIFKKDTCSCECQNGYTSSGAKMIPDTTPQGFTSGVCDLCETSCGSLDKKVQTATKCGCEFNMLHLAWIGLIGAVVLAAIGFGGFKYYQKKQREGPTPLREVLKEDDSDDEACKALNESTTYA